jgi:CheY-like chemotaxis protein
MVDDDPNDQYLVQTALEHWGWGRSLILVKDAEEAIGYLMGQGMYSDRDKYPFPSVILTDLKMPRMDGFDLLEWVRQHPECAVIPTIVLSSSRLEMDVRRAYRLGANSFMVKPQNLHDLTELMRITYEYWAHCERLPVPSEGE